MELQQWRQEIIANTIISRNTNKASKHKQTAKKKKALLKNISIFPNERHTNDTSIIKSDGDAGGGGCEIVAADSQSYDEKKWN